MMRILRSYRTDSRASMALYMALMLPILIASIGMAVDVGMSYLVRARLQGALDAAALATAAVTSSGDVDIGEKLEDYFDSNYPPEKIGVPYDLAFVDTDEALSVTARARYETMFIRILGFDSINIAAEVTITRAVRGIEAVLVLDNTGSMAGSNITALKNAARIFVETLYDRAGDDKDYVKIGIVPYSSVVNTGSYGIGRTPSGDYYGEPFVNLPSGVVYNTNCNTSSLTRWCGCVMAEDYPGDVRDFDENIDPYMFKNCYYAGWPTNGWVCNNQYNLNQYCPRPVVPLTTNRNELLTAINGMGTAGNTLGNLGMIWGYRLLSPEYPFEEGADWDDYIWRKAIVMMTDGDNTIGASSFYSAYGWGGMHGVTTANINSRFVEVCNLLRERGVLVYTIIFTSNINQATRNMYRDCATTSAMYYYAPSSGDLRNAFEKIARELSNLHISN